MSILSAISCERCDFLSLKVESRKVERCGISKTIGAYEEYGIECQVKKRTSNEEVTRFCEVRNTVECQNYSLAVHLLI